MALTKPAQLTTAFAHAGLKNDIPQATTGSNLASFEEGFPVITMTAIADGGTPPQGQDFNGMFYTLTDIARYLQAGAVYPYNAAFCTAIGGYPLGALLSSEDGAKLYINQVNGNTNNPDTNSTNWQTVLTSTLLDAVPTADSTNPVASNGVFDALATKQNTLTFDNAPTSGSINPVTSGGIKTALDAKQDTLTFDSTPTADSNNPVTSQGIKAAIDAKDSLPSQTGHAGEYLKTDGETASWSNVESLPSQTGQAGKVLTTDGTAASWQPVQTRNVGEYVWSALPLTDAGLHLLDGSLLPSGGVYAQFVQHINGLQASYPDLFVTQADFDASVSAYGSCGKFVVSASGVRLPKVSDILQGTTDVTAVGDLIEAGLPNITFTSMLNGDPTSKFGGFVAGKQTGAAYDITGRLGAFATYSNTSTSVGLGFDASRSSPYYKDSVTKPTPQTIKSLLYICVATSVKTQIQVDIDNIATDLNNKLDRDLSNVVGDAVERVVEQGDNYIRYSSGKQICWGDCTATGTIRANSSVNKNTSFPVSFVDSKYNISFGCRIDGGSTNNLRQNAYDRYTSYFKCWWFNSSGASCGSTTYTYTAIGRWK